MRKRLAESDPSDVLARSRVAFAHSRLALLYDEMNELTKALDHAREAARLGESMARIDPAHAELYADDLHVLGRAEERAGHAAAACARISTGVRLDHRAGGKHERRPESDLSCEGDASEESRAGSPAAGRRNRAGSPRLNQSCGRTTRRRHSLRAPSRPPASTATISPLQGVARDFVEDERRQSIRRQTRRNERLVDRLSRPTRSRPGSRQFAERAATRDRRHRPHGSWRRRRAAGSPIVVPRAGDRSLPPVPTTYRSVGSANPATPPACTTPGPTPTALRSESASLSSLVSMRSRIRY